MVVCELNVVSDLSTHLQGVTSLPMETSDTADTHADEGMPDDFAVYHRHDLRKKYLESYWYDRDHSAANRSGAVRHSIQKIKCSPRILKYRSVEALIQQFEAEGNLRQVALTLNELDQYLAHYPGSMGKPEFMKCNNGFADNDVDVEFVEVNITGAEVVEVETYVLQCMIVKVVKQEPTCTIAFGASVKQEADL